MLFYNQCREMCWSKLQNEKSESGRSFKDRKAGGHAIIEKRRIMPG
jgi:hypothetical protein